MRPKKFIMPFVLCLSLIPLAAPLSAADTLQAKVDSMFVIASSGDFKFREMVEPTIEDIASLGVPAVPYLIGKLDTKDSRERVTIRQIFEKIGQAAVPYLNDALLATDSLQLSRVALILYYLPNSSSVENLMQVSDDGFYWVRYQAIRALGKIGDIRAGPVIEKGLTDSNELVRTMAAVAAGRLGAGEFHRGLVKALSDDYYGVRMAAFEELKKLDCGSKRTLIFPYVEKAKSDMELKLLLSIISRSSCAFELESLRPFLIHNDPVVRALALKAASRCPPDSIETYLSRMSDQADNIYLRQVIGEIKSSYEKTPSANP